MNKKKSISKLLIGTTLLMVYCNVLFTQFNCNLSHLFEASENHEHHYSGIITPGEPAHDESAEHNDTKDDNCCKDKTASFFGSQANPTSFSFEFKNTFFTNFICLPNTIVSSNIPFISSKGYFSYESPPPKIPDIRVFTHSFLI